MNEILDSLERYIKLTYIVKRIGAKAIKGDYFSVNFVNNCRYDLFDVPSCDVEIIEGSDLAKLEKLYDKYVFELDKLSCKIFSGIFSLDSNEQNKLREYLLQKESEYEKLVYEEQVAYARVVEQIRLKVSSNAKKDALVGLCILSKEIFSNTFEYSSIREMYSNLRSYLDGLIGKITCKENFSLSKKNNQ